MITVITRLTIFTLTVFAFRAALGAEQSQAESKEQHALVKKEENEPIILEGHLEIIPTCASVSRFMQSLTTPQVLRESFKDLGEREPLAHILFRSQDCRDWESQYHPKLNCHACEYLPALRPLVYKSPDHHPYFLKQALDPELASIIPARGVCALILQYAQNPCSLFDCNTGDTIAFDLLNFDRKKAIAVMKCIDSYEKPFKVQLAYGLLEHSSTSKEFRKQLKSIIDPYEEKVRLARQAEFADQWGARSIQDPHWQD